MYACVYPILDSFGLQYATIYWKIECIYPLYVHVYQILDSYGLQYASV